ncbi:dimethyl sulfoxide reductase anchor subunit [Lutimaribacter sp. EGI FJ00015]|uniref:Dimethyl sulfoxide reductase anchor subunit n=1 Tax=Lutimaribacter degradans TaxID=2945989 RepID=A0ACC6A0B3_9RHOB|nr:DmsC/YnfH family molybdoenzyme membrane anchor subunit [Lutimaribacter sp. EGI FJ00013]MCM2563054.1 dimethyl sulfoxide reductase anchor subunit [Lutimaribacter sp. EGI FJ00013]MCO0614233.1 dimethyl sulfoxide reductase anchor subunit [Lutimaribacter sp. EGI FJ00015]MCO0637043.1 dimethyl sulfoxide reductase anchor subunit [Lutimaribacter sp. EGI FJ00014]
MHPAPSIILFTTLSGLGFGLLAFLGLGMPGATGWVAFAFFAIGFALAGGGLVASTFHLGHPERALKAFTQWRTSWLSREAWTSLATLSVMGLYAIGRVFFDASWQPLGWLGAALSVATVYCTAMIYTSIKAVPRWNTGLTPLHFLTLSAGGGALLAGEVSLAAPLLALAAAVQVLVWMQGDGALARSGTTMASATGLSSGAARAFEPPHTGTNYLLREMVHVVGRKHSRRLRVLALILGYGLPILLLLLPFTHWLGLLAMLTHILGILAARWLFFAEAEHVVGLYYGKR